MSVYRDVTTKKKQGEEHSMTAERTVSLDEFEGHKAENSSPPAQSYPAENESRKTVEIDLPPPNQHNAPKRKKKAKMTEEQIRERLAEAHSSAPSTSAQSKLPPPAEEETEDPKCEICRTPIVPTLDEYFEFHCGYDQAKPQCSFNCHKDCMGWRYNVKKAAELKGIECPRKGCRNPMLLVKQVNLSLEPVKEIRADPLKNGTKKLEVELRQREKKEAKEDRKKKKAPAHQSGEGSPSASVPRSPAAEAEEELDPESDIASESPTKEVSPSHPIETLEEKMELLRLLQRPTVPLVGKKGETEDKYAVTEAAVQKAKRSKKQKVLIPIVFGVKRDAEDDPRQHRSQVSGSERVTCPLPSHLRREQLLRRELADADTIKNSIDHLGVIIKGLGDQSISAQFIVLREQYYELEKIKMDNVEGLLSNRHEQPGWPWAQLLRERLADISPGKDMSQLSDEVLSLLLQADGCSEITKDVEKWLPKVSERVVELARRAGVSAPNKGDANIRLELVKELQRQRDTFDFKVALRNIITRLGLYQEPTASSGS